MTNILLVEDEMEVRDNIQEILTAKNYNCLTASNGKEAFDLLHDNKVDLIISDIMMPIMDGMSFYKKIVQEQKYWNVPFIFLSAKSDDDTVREGMKLGAEDYIKKPFRMNEILEAVEIRLKKSSLEKNRIEKLRENISKYIPHELRTPIGVILGYSNLILEDKDSIEKEDIFPMIEWIEKSGQRLKDRIEKLILLTEIELDIESGLSFDNTTQVNNSFVNDLLLKTVGYYSNKNKLLLDIQESEVSIPLNYLDRILNEIVDNAFKFSEQNNPISIIGINKEEQYLINVIDDGIGMDSDELNQISAFKQFSREMKQQEGNGLGLVIAERICNLVKGDLTIKSKKKQGTTVTISLTKA